jgi:hypothetical protein
MDDGNNSIPGSTILPNVVFSSDSLCPMSSGSKCLLIMEIITGQITEGKYRYIHWRGKV